MTSTRLTQLLQRQKRDIVMDKLFAVTVTAAIVTSVVTLGQVLK